MIDVDFHAHSLFSTCGVHTVVEMLSAAQERGMAGLAITDHGPFLGGSANSVFFERLHDPVPGIRLLKGMECNLHPDNGTTDCPLHFLGFMDLVLLGFHDNVPVGLGCTAYTDLLIRTLEKNPFVDIVTHPNSRHFPVNYDALAAAAKRLGVALELNNSKVHMKRVDDNETEALILACKRAGCDTVLSSDAHVLHEIGNDADIRPLLVKHAFPEERIVNCSAQAAFDYVERRKERKKR
ncbi:MAG: PHP domain-containing protein [Fibrobacterota bacterium]